MNPAPAEGSDEHTTFDSVYQHHEIVKDSWFDEHAIYPSPADFLSMVPASAAVNIVREVPDLEVLDAPPAHDLGSPGSQGNHTRSQEEPVAVDPVVGYPDEMLDVICGQGLDWPCDQALNICWLEMGQKYQPREVNPTTIWFNGVGHNAHGLCQIMLPLHQGYFDGDPLDPYVNARAAYGLWRDSGRTFCIHWSYWC